jgi:hypothetical protein
MTCSVDGCTKPGKRGGRLCSMHTGRLARTGKLDRSVRPTAPYQDRDGTWKVPLSRGMTAMVDAADVEAVGQHIWTATKSKTATTFYASTKVMDAKGNKRDVGMHVLIMSPTRGIEVDHRDGNGLDNRRGNLRTATRSQNQQNRWTQKNNKSGVPGVYWFPPTQRWRAQIDANGRRYYLGYFPSKEGAVAARVDAAMRLHGEFARLAP